MIEKLKLSIACIEEVLKEDRNRLVSPLHIACYNRWIGELRAYRRILKMMEGEENNGDA
ncbi:hypothetical protein BCB4_0050 [Bacillus phage B4]|uniref:Uncharacterized protein n=2 Tax=Bequatrovirus B4 TaxID=1918005 RepID=J9PQS7_9CAUD|nr:hypothetical protein BCB4_0050 [Bacillus phage B4]YP_009783644.1 hypothetical protein QLX26_gp048 [Bacillus phage B5S]AEW47282.1 hypothetical protein B5S_0048 [Bacillus phage B5S]AEZ65843.1 hypothetical protein BCB4_0050 [Bacillus phage B4]